MHVRLNGATGDLALPAGTSILGRGRDCALRINDARLSRHHARFQFDGDDFSVEDAGSTNGVLVNGDRIKARTSLKNGDIIVCGPCVFTISVDPTIAPSPSELLPIPAHAADPHATETMEPLELPESDLPPPAPRKLNPHIAAALSSGNSGGGSDQSSDVLKPSDDSKTGTSALDAQRRGKQPPSSNTVPAAKKTEGKKKEKTTGLIPNDFTPSDGAALQPDFLAPEHGDRPAAWRRLAAAVLDAVTQLTVILVLVVPTLMAGYGWSLWQAGSIIDQGLPRLALNPAQAADTAALAMTLWHPGGMERAAELVTRLARADDQQPFLTLFATGTLAVLTAVMVLILGTLAATVVRGAPFWHRRLGLEIVEARTGYFLTWTRALLRWLLVALLWPFAVLALPARSRSPHDLLSGCQVRARKR
jgi:hypothetical protein